MKGSEKKSKERVKFTDELANVQTATPEEIQQLDSQAKEKAEAEAKEKAEAEAKEKAEAEAKEKAEAEAKAKEVKPNSIDGLQWENVDLGDIEFIKLDVEGEIFTGKFVRSHHSQNPKNKDWPKGNDRFDGHEFIRFSDGQRCILPSRWQLYEYFVNKGDFDGAAKQPDHTREVVYQVVLNAKITASNGNEVCKHGIRFAYLDQKTA